MSMPKETRHSILISVASIILAGIVLLSLRALWQPDQIVAFLPSLVLGVIACLLLFARGLGQAHIALGVYLLTIGGTTMVLPNLLLPGYGQDDPDLLFLFLGPFYLLVGIVPRDTQRETSKRAEK